MSNKIVLESISYLDCQENIGADNKVKSSKISAKDLKASHRKTTSALVRNADALFGDITNSPPSTPKNNTKSAINNPSTPSTTPLFTSTPLKSKVVNNDNAPIHSSLLDGTSLVSQI
ncbi:hypothetical protein DFA_00126 [Cavenderia fasciculata]|uniref:Uncharacterized protein n=1 Tax=Cavenderia fasciculata TaxID=261658 RepID=F4PXN8_CACFS|nr:uncharacterized protein DFA_00126 [Cavenderia fasciculata]EGG19548.1 hypothetical protein DFA_00126 [Cavenderia fasciculata]|eukprot:XP_004357842.1 hypothetical protein DFA_00126 [Cavenderia fasciculata]